MKKKNAIVFQAILKIHLNNFVFIYKVCQADQVQKSSKQQDEMNRYFINWRILNRFERQRPALPPIFKPPTRRSMDFALKDPLNMASPLKSLDPPNNYEGQLQKLSFFPHLVADDDLMISKGKDARPLEYPQKRNLGRWRNMNWIFSVRSGNPKFHHLHKVE